MAGPLDDFHCSTKTDKKQDPLPHLFEEAEKISREMSDFSIKLVREHPAETGAAGAALCLVGICVKNPAIREAAKDALEEASGRVAVGIDDAVMASKRTVQFTVTQLGRDDALYLNQPAYSSFSKNFIRARQAVAKVSTTEVIEGETEYTSGTAFAVSKDGTFVTNHHVATGVDGLPLKNINLIDRFGKQHAAHVVSLDVENDLAILNLSRRSSQVLFKPLPFGKELQPGYHLNPQEEIFCFGHPAGAEQLFGSVKSNIRLTWEKQAIYERHGSTIIPIHTARGSSGSPLLNKQGEVTGVVFGGPERESPLYNSLTLAVPSDKVKALLAKPLEPFPATVPLPVKRFTLGPKDTQS
jgi:S1-C subfamily serine protease